MPLSGHDQSPHERGKRMRTIWQRAGRHTGWALLIATIALVGITTQGRAQQPEPDAPATDPIVALAGQRVVPLCSARSRLMRVAFGATVVRAERALQLGGVSANGVWAVVLVDVQNTGMLAEVPFGAADLQDETGRRFPRIDRSRIGPQIEEQLRQNVRPQLEGYPVLSDRQPIQPGLSSRVLWIYEVPPDVRSLVVISNQPTC